MRILQKLRRKIRWHFIDIMARLGVGDEEVLRQGRRPAYGKAAPKLLAVPLGDDFFDSHDALHGSCSSSQQCADIPYAVWANTDSGGECIRYYPAGLDPKANPLVLLYIPGDVILRTTRGVRLVGKSYKQKTPNELFELMSEWASDAGAPTMYLGRPGIFGSSGDHERRRQLYEIDLMNCALDLIKERHRIQQFILVGQSGGGQIVAALLNRRTDIASAVMTAGLLSVHDTVRRWRRTRPVPGGAVYPVEALYDPLQEVERIRRNPAPQIFVISDPRDSVISLSSQLRYLQKLNSEGFETNHIFAHAEGPKHHNLGAHGRKAAALLATGADPRTIRKALVDMDMMTLGPESKVIPFNIADQTAARRKRHVANVERR
ncbi:alpha/beta hydrolase [Agrobacterium tumefaciens]|uniref:alpha/beta hydrolase n=1 Tax=Agrobacterium tumefaciens TaxID=358 RepID=UPI002242E585|nr:alpha/beta hydrolase [Agrobacterium tumefaciens]MCW8060416.1 alpha/beta hydrolase [Agrobacterium tumefaciens]MCW8145860.1 alpha/beta hydrolase [Agrobacterium tumefaciens]